MTNLVFTPPDENTPGFLRRQREALKFMQLLKGDPTVEAVDGMVDFLVEFVTEPADKNEAVEALWDASEAQFNELLGAVLGKADDAEDPTE
jgi:hypothetical protein